MSIIKKRQPHKPGSVTIFADGLYHQSTAVVADGLYQPTPRQRASQPCVVGIFGLSTHKVYHRETSLSPVVSSYLALAPLPEKGQAVCLSVALSVSRTLSFLLPSR